MSDSLLDSFLEEGAVSLIAKREVHIAVRRDGGVGADGTALNPLDGSTVAKLDKILAVAANNSYAKPNTRFVFGPGIFETQGGPGYGHWNLGEFAWEPLPGCEFVGAGMYSTILRLKILAPVTAFGYNAISGRPQGSYGGSPTPGLLISDMTIDSNLPYQRPSGPDTTNPKPGFPFAACGFGGISVYGDNILIRRVRFINGGSRYPAFDGSEGMSLIPSSETPVTNYRVEDCIFEQPFHSRARETEGISVQGVGPYLSCVFRNNLFDAAIVNPGPFPPVHVRSLVFNGSSGGTLVTEEQHGLQGGDRVRITGSDHFDGIYEVMNPDE